LAFTRQSIQAGPVRHVITPKLLNGLQLNLVLRGLTH